MGIYIETPGLGAAGFYAKIGASHVTVETNESLATGATYGNQDVNGATIGLGFKGASDSGILLKASVEYTNYESVSLKSTGSDVASTIDADPETYGLKVSIGYNF